MSHEKDAPELDLEHLHTYHRPTSQEQVDAYEEINQAALNLSRVIVKHTSRGPLQMDAVLSCHDAGMRAKRAVALAGRIHKAPESNVIAEMTLEIVNGEARLELLGGSAALGRPAAVRRCGRVLEEILHRADREGWLEEPRTCGNCGYLGVGAVALICTKNDHETEGGETCSEWVKDGPIMPVGER